MQDNEFDGLFRNKLDGFESEPSERVWMDVDAGLEGKKRPLLFWLSMAASIVVLVIAGILFIPKWHKVNHSGEGLVKNPPKQAVTKPVEQVAVAQVVASKNELVKEEPKITTTRYKKHLIVAPVPVKPEEMIVKTEQLKPAEQPEVIASIVTPKTDQVKPTPVVPDKQTPLVAKSNIDIDAVTNTLKPALTANAQAQAKPVAPVVKKHGIRNFGDLVNLVVAKVDKRKDKALQFTDNEDDDGSTLTAVNIGPVKLAKDR